MNFKSYAYLYKNKNGINLENISRRVFPWECSKESKHLIDVNYLKFKGKSTWKFAFSVPHRVSFLRGQLSVLIIIPACSSMRLDPDVFLSFTVYSPQWPNHAFIAVKCISYQLSILSIFFNMKVWPHLVHLICSSLLTGFVRLFHFSPIYSGSQSYGF